MHITSEERKSGPLPTHAGATVWHQPSDKELQAKPLTVLIIDDDPVVAETFARMLVLEGYTVLAVVSAEAGLREAELQHVDAILLDLRMPIVNGLDFLRRLRAREQQNKTPVAIVTGDYFLDDSMSNELQGLGAEVFFKPLWIEDLVRITQALIK